MTMGILAVRQIFDAIHNYSLHDIRPFRSHIVDSALAHDACGRYLRQLTHPSSHAYRASTFTYKRATTMLAASTSTTVSSRHVCSRTTIRRLSRGTHGYSSGPSISRRRRLPWREREDEGSGGRVLRGPRWRGRRHRLGHLGTSHRCTFCRAAFKRSTAPVHCESLLSVSSLPRRGLAVGAVLGVGLWIVFRFCCFRRSKFQCVCMS